MRGGWGGGGEGVLDWEMRESGSGAGVIGEVILDEGEFNGVIYVIGRRN